ncbi:MAG: hypothetical protein KC636_35295, partial [Myxococcales bacterium]|nr:hypothetical protein [Myxococcales bacterium]
MLTLPLVLTLTFAADVDVFPQDDLWAALGSAAAGDTITVHAGTYQTPGFVELNLQGTQNAPIVIQAAAGEVVVIQGVSNQNTLNITGSYYTFRGFEITVGSHGLRIGDTAHALFEDLHIHDVNDVGFS